MKEKSVIEEIQSLVLVALGRLREERKLAETAEQTGVKRQRYTEILKGKRTITAYYVQGMVTRGIVKREAIEKFQKRNDLTDEEKRYLYICLETPERIDLLMAAEKQGIDIDALLKSLIIRKK